MINSVLKPRVQQLGSTLKGKIGRIYRIVCIVTGMSYIGLTGGPLRVRVRAHEKLAESGEDSPLYADMRRYGFDAFTVSELATTTALDELSTMEMTYIRDFDTFRNGYNRTLGGERGSYQSPTEKKAKLAVHVASAFDLSQLHGGIIPNSKWLQKNGYSNLDRVIRNNPEHFSGMQQHKPHGHQKIVQDWVVEAEKLANTMNGCLPSNPWLLKNGYARLSQVIGTNPSCFEHIPQEKPHGHYRVASEWVPVADHLAKTNNGVLPSKKHLSEKGYFGLIAAKYKFPALFAHIPNANRKVKTAQEWLDVAEELTQQFHGYLPNTGWLQKNGFQALDRSIRLNADLFKHLNRRFLPAWVNSSSPSGAGAYEQPN